MNESAIETSKYYSGGKIDLIVSGISYKISFSETKEKDEEKGGDMIGTW